MPEPGLPAVPPVDPAALVPSPWEYFFADPTFLVINVAFVAIVITILWFVRRRYARFFNLQREALDHRKTADAQMLDQQQTFEQLIARQHGLTNAHNQELVAKAEEALRLNAETLAQITAMNRTLARIAERLEAGGTAA